MATAVTIPKLGLTMTEAKIVQWLQENGRQVVEGAPLIVIMTAKVTHEIQAPASGTLHIVAQADETRPVSEAIGFILDPGEPVPGPAPTASAAAEGPTAVAAPTEDGLKAAGTVAVTEPPRPADPRRPAEVRSSPAARRLARELGIEIARVQGTGRGGRITEKDVQRAFDTSALDAQALATDADTTSTASIVATPLARRIAEQEGLDLDRVQGTGHDGRITEDDVLHALDSSALDTSALDTSALDARTAPQARPTAFPFTPMRQSIAESMTQSLHSMAQLTLTAKADVTALVALRDVLRQRWSTRISYTDLLVKAVAVALREHPTLNSTAQPREIVLHDEVNVGVAVALDQGLIVPVVRAADVKTVIEIHDEIQDLADRAKQGALSVDEVTGGTFTLTNLGMYGVDSFTPIINPPQAAILGVGRIAQELALIEGQVSARSTMVLSLTIDHRIVDGAPGAAFLQSVAQMLEHPALIFSEGTQSREGG